MPARLVSVLLAAVLAASAAPAAHAAAGGFTDPVRVGDSGTSQPAVALGPNGRGVVAWLDDAGRIRAAVRSGGTWGPARTLARDLDLNHRAEARDVQAAVERDGSPVVAWSELRRRGQVQRVVAAVGRPDGSFGAAATVGEAGDSLGAGLRLVALARGGALAVWREHAPTARRGALRTARLGAGAPRFSPPRAVGEDGVLPAVAATSDGGAILVWGTPRIADRRLRGATVRPSAAGAGHAITISASLSAAPRLVSAGGDAALVVWSTRAPVVQRVRTVDSRRGIGPARDVAGGRLRNEPPRIAVAPDGRVAATWTAFDASPQGGGYRPFLTEAAAGAAFPPASPLDAPTGEDGVPTVAYAADGATVLVYTRSVRKLGPVAWETAVAVRPPGAAAFDAPQVLAPAKARNGLAVTERGGALLAGWPAPDGGLFVSSRG